MKMLESSTETYPLTTIDLSNLCAKPTGERYRSLREWQRPQAWISYAPIRKNWAKIVARQPSLDLSLERDDKAALLRQVEKDCRYGGKDITANLSVAEAIFDWAAASNLRSIDHHFAPYRTPLATNYFFEEGILLLGDRGFAVLLDPRRSSSGLKPAGRDFAFSAMYWKLAGIADYVDIDIAILNITDAKKKRVARLIEFDGSPIFGKSEVEERILETQKIWHDVQLERRARSVRGLAV